MRKKAIIYYFLENKKLPKSSYENKKENLMLIKDKNKLF